MTTHEPIDVAIDAAAARVTQAHPSAALRTNVMARVAVTRPSRAWRRLVFAGGALASVGLAAAVVWPSAPVIVSPVAPVAPVATTADTSHADDPTTTADASSPLPSAARTTRVVRTANEPNADFPMSAAERDWRARATPALDHPDPLEVHALNMRSIDITPLGIEPLTVPALGGIQNR